MVIFILDNFPLPDVGGGLGVLTVVVVSVDAVVG